MKKFAGAPVYALFVILFLPFLGCRTASPTSQAFEDAAWDASSGPLAGYTEISATVTGVRMVNDKPVVIATAKDCITRALTTDGVSEPGERRPTKAEYAGQEKMSAVGVELTLSNGSNYATGHLTCLFPTSRLVDGKVPSGSYRFEKQIRLLPEQGGLGTCPSPETVWVAQPQ